MTFVRTFLMVSATIAGLAIGPNAARGADDPAAVIERQSRAFSDASASGKMSAVADLLDDDVVFVNEGGDVARKADLVQDSPRPPGYAQTLVQTNLVVRLHGDTAVTSFVDVSTATVFGHAIVAKFFSTETWLREGGAWKMIQSQTLALADDPPAIVLPPAVLDEYVGRYRVGPGGDVAIARRGDDLTTSTNGGAPVVLKAEVKDVFFIPGQPRLRRIFVRDASGTVSGYVNRRDGHDLPVARVAAG